MTKSRKKINFSDYEKERKQKHNEKKIPANLLKKLKALGISENDLTFLAECAETIEAGEADWATIAKKIAGNDAAKAIFEKFGIEKEYEEFISIVADAAKSFQDYFNEIKITDAKESILNAKKALIMQKVDDISNNIQGDAKEFVKKFNEIGKNQEITLADLAKRTNEFAKLITALILVTHVGQAIRATHSSYVNLLKSQESPAYWLERQLTKRRILQDELTLIEKAMPKNIDSKHKAWMENLQPADVDNLQMQLFGTPILSELNKLSVNKYRKQLYEKLNELVSIYNKESQSAAEKELLENNKDILKLISGDNNEINQNRIIALVAHLEKTRIMGMLIKREKLIKHRVIAELHNDDRTLDEKTKITDLMNKLVEVNDPANTRSFVSFAKALNNPNRQSDSAETISAAKAANAVFKNQLQKKIDKKEKEMQAKSMLMVAAGFKVAAAVCLIVSAFIPAAAPILVPIAIAIGAVAAILEFAAEKISPGTKKDIDHSFKHFYNKIKKHKKISKKQNTLEEETKYGDHIQPSAFIDEIARRESHEEKLSSSNNLTTSRNVTLAASDAESKNELKSLFSNYEKARKPKKEPKLEATILKNIQKAKLSEDDLTLIAQIVDGNADWAAISKRIAESEAAKAVFKKIGIEEDYKKFIGILTESGGQFQKHFLALRKKNIFKENKIIIANRINELSTGIRDNVKDLIKKIEDQSKVQNTPWTDHAKEVGKLINSLVQITHVSQAIHSTALSYNNLLNSQDFPYWLTRQLTKRRMIQDELQLIANERSKYVINNKDATWLDGLVINQTNMNKLQINLFETSRLSEINKLSFEEYRKNLVEKINKLIIICEKPEADRSEKEKEIIKNNQDILNHIVDENNKVKNGTVMALIAHLEKEKILGTLIEREASIQNRIIAELNTNLKKPEKQDGIKDILKKFVEKDNRPFISETDKTRTKPFLEFSKNPNMYDNNPIKIAEAEKINNAYIKQLRNKTNKKEKELYAKSILLIAAGLTLAATIISIIAASVIVAAPVLIPIALTLAAIVAIAGFAAERVSPGVTHNLKESFKHVHKKIKKQTKIEKRLETLEDEIINADTHTRPTSSPLATQPSAAQQVAQPAAPSSTQTATAVLVASATSSPAPTQNTAHHSTATPNASDQSAVWSSKDTKKSTKKPIEIHSKIHTTVQNNRVVESTLVILDDQSNISDLKTNNISSIFKKTDCARKLRLELAIKLVDDIIKPLKQDDTANPYYDTNGNILPRSYIIKGHLTEKYEKLAPYIMAYCEEVGCTCKITIPEKDTKVVYTKHNVNIAHNLVHDYVEKHPEIKAMRR